MQSRSIMRIVPILFFLFLYGCSPAHEYFSSPSLLGIQSVNHQSIAFDFDRDVILTIIDIDPSLNVVEIVDHTIFFESTQAGRAYWVEVSAAEANSIVSLRFNSEFFGVAEATPARAVINELSIIHNASIRDAIELFVLEDGNLAGTAIYIGTPELFVSRFVFGDTPVSEGDFIVINADLQENFYFSASPRLPNTRGIITIASSAHHIPFHAVAYERLDAAQSNSLQKRQFDQNMLYLYRYGLWIGAPIDNTHVTATRSLNRGHYPLSNPEIASRWYTTVTSGQSIGGINNPLHFEPTAAAR